MPGLAPDAPDRVTISHRETSAPSSPPHEADKVALEEQLEGTRITRRDDPSSLYPILNGGCRKTMCFRVNHYTH